MKSSALVLAVSLLFACNATEVPRFQQGLEPTSDACDSQGSETIDTQTFQLSQAQGDTPTKPATVKTPARTAACPANPATKVFVHYMLWFDGPDAGVNTGPGVGGHWGQSWYASTGFDFSAYPAGDGCNNYDSLPTYNPPIGGQFATYDPAHVQNDVALMASYCIDGVILDYQQPEYYPNMAEEDRVIDRSLPVVVEAIEAAGLKFAIMYDTSSQTNWGWEQDDWSMQTSTARAQENWAFIFETAANSSAYLRDDVGNSVFLGFGPTPMPNASTAALCPNCVFYAQYGDKRVFNEIGTWPDLPFDHGYFTWGSGDESSQTNYDKHEDIYTRICQTAPGNYAAAPTPCIGSALAGFYAVYTNHGQMRHDPVRLRDTLDLCREKGLSWCQVMTWNDYNEGTQIAPSEWCDESGTPTNNPNQFLDVIKAFKVEGAVVSGTGDPHLTNVRGERFDLLQPGKHIFLQIPLKAPPQETLLRVVAEVQNIGRACADMYIQALNVTGQWADAKLRANGKASAGGFQYNTQETFDQKGTNWLHFGKVELKVVLGHTIEGIKYLNVFAKNLGQAGYPVGGLLGEDDHTAASTPSAFCRYTVALDGTQNREGTTRRGSIGEASLL